MQLIVNCGITKARISSTLHTAVRYRLLSLVGIGLFDPILIQSAGQIDFLIEHFWKPTPYSPLIRANLSTLQLEAG